MVDRPMTLIEHLEELRRRLLISVLAFAAATIVSFVSGYLAIAWLLKWISTHSFNVFVIYRVLLAAGVITLAAAGLIE